MRGLDSTVTASYYGLWSLVQALCMCYSSHQTCKLGSKENCVLAIRLTVKAVTQTLSFNNFTTSKLFGPRGEPHQDGNDEHMTLYI